MDENRKHPRREEQNTVCFTGHRIMSDAEIIRSRLLLSRSIREYYRLGYRWFICGGALGFDTLAAQELIRAKHEYSDIGLCLAIPCADQASRWKKSDQKTYQYIRDEADEVIVLATHYYTGCMHLRNQFMVQHASVCICWLNRFSGGTGYTVRYALASERKVINLCMPEPDAVVQIKESPWNFTFIFPSVPKNAHIVHSIPLPAAIAKKWNNMYLRFSARHPSVHR